MLKCAMSAKVRHSHQGKARDKRQNIYAHHSRKIYKEWWYLTMRRRYRNRLSTAIGGSVKCVSYFGRRFTGVYPNFEWTCL